VRPAGFHFLRLHFPAVFADMRSWSATEGALCRGVEAKIFPSPLAVSRLCVLLQPHRLYREVSGPWQPVVDHGGHLLVSGNSS
jgi:hypothetical protein